MCGIIGYSGSSSAAEKIIDGLKALEYRGYDSVGIAAFLDNDIFVSKKKGRINFLEENLKGKDLSPAKCGIGHTRWATHGAPSDANAHPHGTDDVCLVHNGIIENYIPLKKQLIAEGKVFLSETDTEIVTKLIDKYYKLSKDPIKAIRAAAADVIGSYALGILFKDIPDTIYALRKDSPLIVAFGEDGCYIASDMPAVLKHTRKYIQLNIGEIAILSKEGCTIIDKNGDKIEPDIQTADWDINAAEKGNYPHFMLKEIYEEPISVIRTVSPRIINSLPDFSNDGISDDMLAGFERIRVIACGSAMHAGMVGKYISEKLARMPVEIDIASEFRYCDPILSDKELYVIISQSGETADTLAALRLIKDQGKKTLAIVNVIGSAIAREADYVLYTHAGPEIAVATTKGYCVQVAAMTLLAIKFALIKGLISKEEGARLSTELAEKVPKALEEVFNNMKKCEELAEKIKSHKDLFYIGRGIDYNLSLESSLKLKEISYIHSEAYAAGELKHGTISLVTEGVPVIAISSSDKLYDKTASNIKECKARGAYIIFICRKNAAHVEDIADDVLYLPDIDELLAPVCAVAYSQILAYKTALALGCDVDKPRNLAKSVTVE
ncbi:MAG: glutamine--fructose-6-phosphate transaminase (isomerizing) [Ruminococcaceae bacterium]|nr:glutamine--fructose-6-phosphate transaminase (isomerizing) [Oscillospiraceae bacterium]